MPNLPLCAGAAAFQRVAPLSMAGAGFAGNTELGFPTGAGAITSAARVDSNPILVAGLNSFLFSVECTNLFNVFYSHCNPLTDAILRTFTLIMGTVGLNVLTLGAFETDPATFTTGNVFHTIRLGLQGDGANETLVSARLWLGMR